MAWIEIPRRMDAIHAHRQRGGGITVYNDNIALCSTAWILGYTHVRLRSQRYMMTGVKVIRRRSR